jgi:predicted dehydrogenase
MTAYRLHFDRANLEAIELIRSGKLGEPRIFESLFSMQVRDGNIRLKKDLGGGTLYDIGIYCINAARYLFAAEPIEVFAFSANNGERRFVEVDEMSSAVLRFPEERLATFTSSFGAVDTSNYEVLGTKGSIRLTNPYDYESEVDFQWTVDGKKQARIYPKKDQFAAELVYFSDCVLKNQPPEPSGVEGLIDVHIIRSLYESARTGMPVKLRQWTRKRRPNVSQEIKRPPVRKPKLVHAASPTM